jgi:uncharacterized protein YjbJ (UPF0337 family)
MTQRFGLADALEGIAQHVVDDSVDALEDRAVG